MNLQDKFPYNSAIVGLDNKYIAFKDSFYVNSECIDLPNRTITKDAYYNLVECDENITKIQIKEVFCFEGYVYLLIVDMRNLKVELLDIGLGESAEWKITPIA